MPKRQRQSLRKSDRALIYPRPLTQRQRSLIALYSNCPLGMTPQQFYTKWEVTQQELALICSRSISTVQRWFTNGCSRRRPSSDDLRHLALMDFLLEHFEEIPQAVFDVLCPRQEIQE